MKDIPHDFNLTSETLQSATFDDGGGGDFFDSESSYCLSFDIQSQSEEFYVSTPHYLVVNRSIFEDPLPIDVSTESSNLGQVQSDGLFSSPLSDSQQQSTVQKNQTKLNGQSKKIKKEKKPRTPKATNKKPRKRKPREIRPLPQRIKERLADGHAPFSEAFQYSNPGKNTPKRVSILLRKKLDELGFDITKIQSKRVRPGYLHICLLHLSHRLNENDFHLFMMEYRQWLRSELDWEQSLYDKFGDEVSKRYVHDLALAGQASILFEKNLHLESLDKFLGDGKEEKYRGQNIIIYIEEVRNIYNEKKIPLAIPENAQLIKINEKSLYTLKKIVKQIEGLQAKENFVDSVLAPS